MLCGELTGLEEDFILNYVPQQFGDEDRRQMAVPELGQPTEGLWSCNNHEMPSYKKL